MFVASRKCFTAAQVPTMISSFLSAKEMIYIPRLNEDILKAFHEEFDGIWASTFEKGGTRDDKEVPQF